MTVVHFPGSQKPCLYYIWRSHIFQQQENLIFTVYDGSTFSRVTKVLSILHMTVAHFPAARTRHLYCLWRSHIFQQQENVIYTVYDGRTLSSGNITVMEDFLHHLRVMDYFLPKILILENVRYADSWVWNLCHNVALFPHLNFGHFPADIFQSSD